MKRPDSDNILAIDDVFMIRAPLLNVESWSSPALAFKAAPALATGAPGDDAVPAFVEDCERIRSAMRQLVSDPIVSEAIYVSSPALAAGLDAWREDPLGERGAAAERSLYSYLTRAATRPTPYGLLAGVGAGRIGEGERCRLAIGSRTGNRRHARLDSSLVVMIAAAIAGMPESADRLRYVPNSTIYRMGGRYRYYEGAGHSYSGRTQLVSVAWSAVLETLLECAGGGATRAELIRSVQSTDAEASAEEAGEFVDDILAAQVLVCDLYPSPLGKEMLVDLKVRAAALGMNTRTTRLIDQLLDGCATLDRLALGQSGTCYEELGAALRDHSADEETDAPSDQPRDGETPTGGQGPVQIDMTLECSGLFLEAGQLEPLPRAILALHAINGRSEEPPLRQFCEEFRRRYETRFVPLSEVLDPDGGIKFGQDAQAEPSPLLALIDPGRSRQRAQPRAHAADSWKTKILLDSAERSYQPIRLTSREIHTLFPAPLRPPPRSMSVMITLVGSPNELEEGRSRLQLLSCGAAHSLVLLGRFAHVLGEEFTAVLRRMADDEQEQSRSVLAQVSYLAPARLGNVTQSPRFRRHVIPYASPLPSGEFDTLPIDDLWLTTAGDRAILWSRRLGRPVEPRIDNALNIMLPAHPRVYQFFGMLQSQDSERFLHWSWSSLAGLPHLPQVWIDDVLVSPETWTVSAGKAAELEGSARKGSFQGGGFGAFCRAQAWRRELGLPRWLTIGDQANYLAVDLDNPASVDLMLRELRGGGEVREMVGMPDAMPVAGPEGRYRHELVVTLARRKPEIDSAPAIPPPDIGTQQPILRVKDGVLFARVYGGEALLDQFLRGRLRELIDELLRKQTFAKWFFIRYADPHPHLRLRFFGDPEVLVAQVMPALEDLCREERESGIYKLTWDGYEPEVARYGGPEGSRMAERLFCIDSTWLLPLLTIQTAAAGPSDLPRGIEGRWVLALASARRFVSDFGLSPAEELEFVRSYAASMAREYGFDPARFKRVNAFLRRVRALVERLGRSPAEVLDPAVVECLSRRSQELRPVFGEIRGKVTGGVITAAENDLLKSYLHMHLNRLFVSRQRSQEVVLLQLLERTMTAEARRSGPST